MAIQRLCDRCGKVVERDRVEKFRITYWTPSVPEEVDICELCEVALELFFKYFGKWRF